jgi:hypothetical protein
MRASALDGRHMPLAPPTHQELPMTRPDPLGAPADSLGEEDYRNADNRPFGGEERPRPDREIKRNWAHRPITGPNSIDLG